MLENYTLKLKNFALMFQMLIMYVNVRALTEVLRLDKYIKTIYTYK
jgi:hypothetical protein